MSSALLQLSHAVGGLAFGDTAFAPLLGLAGMAGPEVDINVSFVVAQFVVFLVLILALKPVLLEPLLKVFDAREAMDEGTRDEARTLQERSGELLRKYEGELARINRVAAEERDRARAETTRLEARILAEAHEAAARVVEEGRARIDGELGALRTELAARTPALSRELASSVLGREVRS